MNDFLQSIRNQSKDKRYQSNNRPRRPFDNNGNGNHNNNHHHSQQQHHHNQSNYHRNNDNHQNNNHQNNYHRNNDNRKFHQRPRNDFGQRDENLGMIKELLETLVAQQGQAMEIHERRAIAEERKADAIEDIASIISSLAGAEFPSIDKVVSGIDAVAREFEEEIALQAEDALEEMIPEEEKAPAVEFSKEEIVEIIHKMREEGSTYNEVAAHLTEMGLPTFSGRGKWHAQTIHRLCQQES